MNIYAINESSFLTCLQNNIPNPQTVTSAQAEVLVAQSNNSAFLIHVAEEGMLLNVRSRQMACKWCLIKRMFLNQREMKPHVTKRVNISKHYFSTNQAECVLDMLERKTWSSCSSQMRGGDTHIWLKQ